jgi:hypothetical protein
VPPLKVNILHTETRFVAGEYADIRCEAIGSRPAAQITWWKDNERLADSSHKVRHSLLKLKTRRNWRVRSCNKEVGPPVSPVSVGTKMMSKRSKSCSQVFLLQSKQLICLDHYSNGILQGAHELI